MRFNSREIVISKSRESLVLIALATLLAGCGGGGSSSSSVPITVPTQAPTSSPTATPTPMPTATPTAAPAPGPVALSPSSLSFGALGATYAVTVTASESNFTGAFAVTLGTCSSLVGIDSPTTNGAFTITPQAVGTCTAIIAGASGQTSTLQISVTATTLGGV